MNTYDKRQYLLQHVPNICIDEHTKAGHIEALYWLYRLATDTRAGKLANKAAERIFDLVEDGNYDVALDSEVMKKEISVLRAQLNYDVDMYSDHAEAGD